MSKEFFVDPNPVLGIFPNLDGQRLRTSERQTTQIAVVKADPNVPME
jgi:hypothetical protein